MRYLIWRLRGSRRQWALQPYGTGTAIPQSLALLFAVSNQLRERLQTIIAFSDQFFIACLGHYGTRVTCVNDGQVVLLDVPSEQDAANYQHCRAGAIGANFIRPRIVMLKSTLKFLLIPGLRI